MILANSVSILSNRELPEQSKTQSKPSVSPRHPLPSLGAMGSETENNGKVILEFRLATR